MKIRLITPLVTAVDTSIVTSLIHDSEPGLGVSQSLVADQPHLHYGERSLAPQTDQSLGGFIAERER
jgi:hypothetical protein